MRKLLAFLTILLVSNTALASVDYVTVKECRSIFFGKSTEGEAQDKINQDLMKKLNERGATKVDFIKYGNQQEPFRDKGSACIIATAWFEK